MNILPELSAQELADVSERFYAKIDRSNGDDACWLWRSTTNWGGYGSFKLKRRYLPAHRVSLALANGNFPNHLCVLHSCDTPGCVNPKRLRLGTQKENAADRTKRKRHTGLSYIGGRLSESQRRRIVDDHKSGVPAKAIARSMGIADGTVRYHLRRAGERDNG